MDFWKGDTPLVLLTPHLCPGQHVFARAATGRRATSPSGRFVRPLQLRCAGEGSSQAPSTAEARVPRKQPELL